MASRATANPNVYIIAGSNGDGKTIFARKFLPLYAKCPNFINADLIAQGLSPFNPEGAAIKAGRLVLEQIKQFSKTGTDFGFETTLSGKTYLPILKDLKSKEYSVHIFYLWIPNVKLALGRIKDRVSTGGHNVPSRDVRRRFSKSLNNFLNNYRHLADDWSMFNNATISPALIAKSYPGTVEVVDKMIYETILKQRGSHDA